MSTFPQRMMVAIAALSVAGIAGAATITVTTIDDGPLGGSTTECSLRAAIASANDATGHDGCAAGSDGADDIRFDAGLAGETMTLTEGQFSITDTLTIAGPSPEDAGGIQIDADQASRHFSIIGEDLNPFQVDLSGLTLTGGATSGDTESGGAIDVEDADLRLEHVVVSGNSTVNSGSNASGGGISVRDGKLELSHSEVTDNAIAEGASGGGIAVVLGELVVSDTRIADNAITTGTFGRGGGISVFRSNATVVNSTISGNSINGERSRGGGMAFRIGGFELILIDSTIAGNSIQGDDSLGGGLHIERAVGTLINSTLSGNSVSGTNAVGGGLRVGGNDTEPGSASLTHTTLAGNSAEGGADGIEFDPDTTSAMELNNSLVVQAGAGETACSGSVTAINSLATDDSCTGTATDTATLALGPLQDYGGPTQTHALLAGSAAIDAAGDCQGDFGIDADQRGRPRPGTGSTACDIGAFERQDTVFSDRFESLE